MGRGGLIDETITPEYVAREVRELARRWDEVAEREAPLGARWKKLRASLGSCTEEAYAAAREAGDEVLARAPIGLKCAVVATFPREGAWAEKVARELLASKPPPKWSVRILGSLHDVEVAKELASALVVFGPWPILAMAPDLIASLGDGAADVLFAIEPHVHETRDRNALLHAIALVKTEKVAAWLAQRLDDTLGRRVAAKFFRENPELARVLESTSKKRSSVGRAAKALMAFADDDASPLSRVAPQGDLPEILRAPPWRTGAMKKAGGVIDDVALVQIHEDASAKAAWGAKIDWVPYAHVASSTSAWAIAHAYFERPEVRDVSRAWMLALPMVAATGLVPMAVGNDARRRNACRALRMLRDEGHAAEVDAAAAHYGEKVARAVAVALSHDPRLDVPLKAPPLPKNIGLSALPPPRLKSGEGLPEEAVRNLAELLLIASDLVPYVGVAEVAAACDARSLEAFSWGLFEAWIATGSSTKVPWPLLALAIFGGDAVARDLGPRLRGWSQQGKNVLATSAVRVLEAIALRGSDVAVVQLVNTASGARSDDVKDRADEALAAVAKTRGLDRDQLADRATPTIDGLELDLGSRKVTASADASGVVILRDGSGDALDAFPRATKDDDAKLFEAAKETLRAFKADAQEVYRAQTRRFEIALRESRTWSREDFEGIVLQKRVLFDIARRLVWCARDGSGARIATFHIVEDRSYADAEDRHADLAGAVRFQLLHPLDASQGELARWGALFGDYEIMQPFPQIGRETYTLTAEEAKSDLTTRFHDIRVEVSRFYALDYRGWSRSHSTFTIGAGGALSVSFRCTPGFQAPLPLPPQQVSELRVSTRDRTARQPVLGDVDRIRMSEILRDVAQLAG